MASASVPTPSALRPSLSSMTGSGSGTMRTQLSQTPSLVSSLLLADHTPASKSQPPYSLTPLPATQQPVNSEGGFMASLSNNLFWLGDPTSPSHVRHDPTPQSVSAETVTPIEEIQRTNQDLVPFVSAPLAPVQPSWPIWALSTSLVAPLHQPDALEVYFPNVEQRHQVSRASSPSCHRCLMSLSLIA